jgi:hypothetical protein
VRRSFDKAGRLPLCGGKPKAIPAARGWMRTFHFPFEGNEKPPDYASTNVRKNLDTTEGPLGVHIDLYAAQLLKEGPCRQSAWCCLRVVRDFSCWLKGRSIHLGEVDKQTVQKYEQFRLRYRRPFLSDRPALNRLLVLLRSVNAIAPKPPVALSPHEQIFEDFRRYLFHECGSPLSPSSAMSQSCVGSLKKDATMGHSVSQD